MTDPVPAPPRSEVDPVVLSGEPGGAAQLEGGDEDLLASESPLAPDEPEREPDDRGEWAGVDRVVDANPTALGE